MSAFRRPKKEYSQAERVLALYDMLYREGSVRPERECQTFSVAKRTLERDIAVLRRMLGARLERYEDPELGVVYRLPYSSRRWKLTPWQLLAVGVGTRMTGFLSGKQFATEIKPLLEQFKSSLLPGERRRINRLERKIHVVTTGQKDYRTNPDAQDRLAVMLEGLLIEKPVELSYLSHRQRAARRPPRKLVVHPLSLVIHRGGVYFIVDVVGGNWTEASRIQLALDRIQAAEIPEGAEMFSYPREFSPAAFLAGAFGIFAGDEHHRVELSIDAEYAPYVAERHWHDSQTVTSVRGGGLRVVFTVGHLGEVADWVLGMGEHAKVVRPAALRKLVQERLKGALARYGDRLAT